MRQKIIFAAICLVLLALFVIPPLIWQWSYRANLVHAVKIGSTRDEYIKALVEGQLGQGMPRPGFTFWRPFQAHGFVYTIVAFPQWNSGGHLSGYSLYPKISLRGHSYYLAHPKWPDNEDLLN
jgi:hypothetical protein